MERDLSLIRYLVPAWDAFDVRREHFQMEPTIHFCIQHSAPRSLIDASELFVLKPWNLNMKIILLLSTLRRTFYQTCSGEFLICLSRWMEKTAELSKCVFFPWIRIDDGNSPIYSLFQQPKLAINCADIECEPDKWLNSRVFQWWRYPVSSWFPSLSFHAIVFARSIDAFTQFLYQKVSSYN